jgi:hypothetical protein
MPLADEFRVNSHTNPQSLPAIAADATGDVVVTWESEDQDGSGLGVFGRRFVVPVILDIDADGSTGALTDGLLVLRYLFGFKGGVLVTGAVGAGCTRCDAAAIEAYLATVI